MTSLETNVLVGKFKKETDIFPIIKSYFEEKGYHVNAEVAFFDVILSKPEKLIIVECKLSFNMTLVFQAMEAQKVADFVYVAIPVPQEKKIPKIIHVAKNMGFGLIFVNETGRPIVPVDESQIEAYQAYRNKIKSERVKKEISSRRFDKNVGGSSKIKILTSFKEKSLQIAVMLENSLKERPKDLVKKYNCPEDTGIILYGNKLHWFERVEKGYYKLSKLGETALSNDIYKDAVEYYRNQKNKLRKL